MFAASTEVHSTECVVEKEKNADHVVEREHPASDEDFAVVAVFATLAMEMDATGSALPLLWPRVLHCVSNFVSSELALDAASIPLLMRALRSSIPRHQRAGAEGIHLLLDSLIVDSPIANELAAAGAMPLLAAMLEDDSVLLSQVHVLRALYKFSSVPKHAAALVNVPGVVATFVTLLCSDVDVGLLAMLAFNNCTSLLSGAVLSGALNNLVQVLTRSKDDERSNRRFRVGWAIECCLRARLPPPLSLVATAIPVLVEMVNDECEKLAIHALRVLANISDCGGEYISVMLDNGVVPAITKHLQSPSSGNAGPALRCLCNILQADARQTALTAEHGAITALHVLRAVPQDPSRSLERKQDILQAFGNIAGGGAQQVNALLQAGVFDLIADDVKGDEGDIRDKSQRTVATALRRAFTKDRIAIIGSASFRALLTAAEMQRVGFAGMEGIDFVLNRTADVDADTDELTVIVHTLRDIRCVEVQQYLERINGLWRCFKAEPLQDVTSILQQQRPQPRPTRP
jgi:hypothetical protein